MENYRDGERNERRADGIDNRSAELAYQNQTGRNDAVRTVSSNADAHLPRLTLENSSELNQIRSYDSIPPQERMGDPYRSFRSMMTDRTGEARIHPRFSEENSKVDYSTGKPSIRIAGQLYVRNTNGEYAEIHSEEEIGRTVTTTNAELEQSKPRNPALRASMWRSRWLPRR